MIPTLNRHWSRQIDRRAIDDYGMSGLVLMENAGRGLAELLLRLELPEPFVVCCGKGNNAGDGYVIARHLDLASKAVRVLQFFAPEELAGDADANFRILRRSDVPIDIAIDESGRGRAADHISTAGTLVDALLGTGARGEPRPPLDWVIDKLNAAKAPKIAVDLPSGLDCDTGQAAQHTVRATHTGTFVANKPGFLVSGAQRFTGQVHVLSIGVPRRLLDEVVREASGI